ncbi:ribosome recycling factor [Candidatus Microgenomates bacterium]|nr:ribosome recycling factor [Candidatus Microgenomates bacterium]
MDQQILLPEIREKMGKALEVLEEDLGTIRSGRATPSLVENIKISCYNGTQTLKLLELATITTQDGRTLLVAPFDSSVIEEIEKGILSSNLGLTPAVDGTLIRVTIPPLSEERRREYLKLAKAKLEGGRIMIRQIRKEVMMRIRRSAESDETNEDEKKHLEDQVQEVTNEVNSKIEMMGKRKEEELMTV